MADTLLNAKQLIRASIPKRPGEDLLFSRDNFRRASSNWRCWRISKVSDGWELSRARSLRLALCIFLCLLGFFFLLFFFGRGSNLNKLGIIYRQILRNLDCFALELRWFCSLHSRATKEVQAILEKDPHGKSTNIGTCMFATHRDSENITCILIIHIGDFTFHSFWENDSIALHRLYPSSCRLGITIRHVTLQMQCVKTQVQVSGARITKQKLILWNNVSLLNKSEFKSI